MTDNLLENNEFVLKVNDKDAIKEITLRKYSFAVQLKLMKSGLINRLIDVQKQLGTKKTVNPENIDFVKFGELLETSSKIIYEMLPKDIQLSKTVDDLLETMVDGEPMRFIQWIFEQFGRTNSFLAPENPKEDTQPESNPLSAN